MVFYFISIWTKRFILVAFAQPFAPTKLYLDWLKIKDARRQLLTAFQTHFTQIFANLYGVV